GAAARTAATADSWSVRAVRVRKSSVAAVSSAPSSFSIPASDGDLAVVSAALSGPA
ncbi:hypothetical protein HRW14_09230, partial [Streptomyces lunaelactis]|nr:hypothetical protein [Streptomyces lunaelactis]